LFFPFPISVGVLLLVLFLVNIARTEIALRKAGIGGLYRSHSSLGLRRGIRNGLVYTPLKFYCMNCGQEHKKIACPKCGSKAVRTG
jgi:ribosomal protein L37AE/L43A